MTASSNGEPNSHKEAIFLSGYFLLICLVAAACGAAYLSVTHLAAALPTPTTLPLLTTLGAPPATPAIAPIYQAGVTPIFKDDFQDNHNDWYDDPRAGDVSVDGGKLYFDSIVQGDYATATTAREPLWDKPFYIQADFTTATRSSEGYGILFAYHRSTDDFLVFEVNPALNRYFFYEHIDDFWSLRLSGVTQGLRAYPSRNTVGIYVNGDRLEFYINYGLVDRYEDSGTDFQSGETGFYVNDAGFLVVVSSFSIDPVGGRP